MNEMDERLTPLDPRPAIVSVPLREPGWCAQRMSERTLMSNFERAARELNRRYEPNRSLADELADIDPGMKDATIHTAIAMLRSGMNERDVIIGLVRALKDQRDDYQAEALRLLRNERSVFEMPPV